MGEMKRRALADEQVVKLDFRQITFCMGRGDRENLKIRDYAHLIGAQWVFTSEDAKRAYQERKDLLDETVAVRALALLLPDLVKAKFGELLGRHDGRRHGEWQKVLYADEPTAEVSWGAVRWLRDLVTQDLNIRADFSQWREALIEYLETLAPEPSP